MPLTLAIATYAIHCALTIHSGALRDMLHTRVAARHAAYDKIFLR